MPASLCIHILSASQTNSEEIRFFTADDWNTDAEMKLMAKIKDIFSLTRSQGLSVQFDVTIETNEVSQATFLLKKKAVNEISINNYKLSIREIEVLGLIIQGMTNQEIALKLFISYETVRSHRKNILEKTGAKNTAALITYYHQTFFEK